VKSTDAINSPVQKQDRSRLVLSVALAVGLIVRIVILWNTSALAPQFQDEHDFIRLATNLAMGNGFVSGHTLTSIRPPLYPAVVAGVWSISDRNKIQTIRLLQIALTLLTTGFVYQIGKRVYNLDVGRYAAALFWLYPSLIFFDFLILSETLFTFLLVAYVLCGIMLLQRPRAATAALCGLSLGLATLARSVLFPVPALLCPLLFFALDGPRARRAGLVALVLSGYMLAVVPWAVRNTRVQGVLTLVDTMGGMHLRMGNYEYTPTYRMWDTAHGKGPTSWMGTLQRELRGQSMTEGQRDAWARRKAFEYILAHPVTTMRRSLTKFADFWGLEREFMAAVSEGLFHPPTWFMWIATFAILLGYAFVATAGAAGIWLAPPSQLKFHFILLLPVLAIMGLHTIAFGHSRYHLPLVPILCIYGAALVFERLDLKRRRFMIPSVLAAAASVVVLLGIWIQQAAFADLTRIQLWLAHVK
jgi:hypothetical protein